MKKTTAFFLIIVTLFSLFACGNNLSTGKIKKNLEDAGFTVGDPETEDMELLSDLLPKEAISGYKGLESISVFVYDSGDQAQKAVKTYTDALGDLANYLGDLVKIGVRGNTFYLATNDEIIETAYKGM